MRLFLFYFQWYKNDAPIIQERNRVSVKTKLKGDPTQWSTLKFKAVETLVRKIFIFWCDNIILLLLNGIKLERLNAEAIYSTLK